MGKTNFSIDFYEKRITDLAVELHKYKQRSNSWVVIRLLSFSSIIVFTYLTFPYSNNVFALLIPISFVLFLYFVRKSAENKEKLNFTKHLIKINEDEIKASNHDFSSFRSGKEYNDPNHPFSYDMDIFGEGSFFQFFNRTVTRKGEQYLVQHLLNGIKNPQKSVDAIDELKYKKEWYQSYLAHGGLLEKDETEESLTALIDADYKVPKWIQIIRFILPVLAVLITALLYFEILNGLQFIILAILIMLPIQRTLKKTNALHQSLSKRARRVSAMSNQLALVEKEEFSSDLLVEYYNQLFKNEKNGKQGLTELSKIIKQAEYRNNVLVGVLLNFFTALDFYLLIKAEKWFSNYKEFIPVWEEIVYEFEGLISGANYRNNFEVHTSIPQLISDKNGKIELKNIGHPLIPIEKLVKNSFTLSETENLAIITGPNMAGKSTFLRSIGVNLVLALAGFHVFAESFVFPNMKLYSSMRTSDDLKDETSYFHAELLRLRFIVDAIENGENVFIILDEILKGTNSKDKAEGSAKFLKKLNQLEVKGIIATHDLSLTKLADEYPSIINRYFDTEIKGDEISFDYCIRNGVAKNMNASFLLHKMGLVDN